MKTAVLIARILLGIIFLVFGLNGFLILAPVIVHIVEFHVFLAPAGLPLAVLVATLAMFLAWTHRPAYRPLFTASVVQSASMSTPTEDARVHRRA